jgi:phage tail protein X
LPDQYYLYTTLQGDTFDMIALDFFDNEVYASKILQANPEHRKVLVFDAGVTLKIPLIEQSTPETLPPWKR